MMQRKLQLGMGLGVATLVAGLSLGLAAPVAAQDGYSRECGSAEFENGAGFTVVQMRSGFEYTATVIGLDDFDPVLVVEDDSGDGLCSDDDEVAADYFVDLPTTGSVNDSSRSSQVRFSQNSSSAFADVHLIVGGYDSQGGEFVLILEGMAATEADGGGDPFAINFTESMIESEVPVTMYMISTSNDLDPLLYLVDEDGEVVQDDDDNDIFCDNSDDDDECWTQDLDLDGSEVVFRNPNNGVLTELPGAGFDAVLQFPVLEDFEDQSLFVAATGSGIESQYVLAFHAAIAGE